MWIDPEYRKPEYREINALFNRIIFVKIVYWVFSFHPIPHFLSLTCLRSICRCENDKGRPWDVIRFRMHNMDKSKISNNYMVTVIVAGGLCILAAILNVDLARIDIFLALLAIFTIAVGSRLTIEMPRFNSHISVSDIFIFLTLLLYGGEFAVLLAAAEATASAWRFCHRKLTVMFNAATMAISTSAVVWVLKASGLFNENQLHGHTDYRQNFVIALSLIALTQFLVNTSLASVYRTLRDKIPFWETWKSKYIWTFFSYFVGAGSAGLLIQMADVVGSGIILATFPVIFFVFLSYRMYLKNVEISVKQAEQAEEYAKNLEAQSSALLESEQRFRSAFNYAPIGIGLVSSAGKWLKVNRAMIEILGYSEEEFLASDFHSITMEDDLGDALIKVHELLTGKIANYQREQRFVHKSGHTVWASWSVSAASDAKAEQPNLIFQIQDITARKLAEQKLHHDATHDALTGLPNRAFFMSRLSEALQNGREMKDYKVSVLFIDLDRFKYVNDSLGHLVGDDLLKGIAARLTECLRPADMVARLGGDEFTILVEGKYDVDEVNRIAERIQKKFSVAFDLRGHEVYSSASIGILHASEKHMVPEDIMRDADTAMYQAKRAGKARHTVFDEKMHSAAKEILRLETDLRRAVERKEIEVYYQPIYSLATGTIEGVEALARWEHAELGEIPPDKFIPLAEEIGLIDKLCEQVLISSCRAIGSLKNTLGEDFQLSVSVNISCRQFAQPALVKTIKSILDETSFSPRDLKLEITESVFFEHAERAIDMLHELRELGIEINIDDFGTGYSNLGYLMKLPISKLKIDRSFVSMIDAEGGNDDIVRAIVTLARNLGLEVIAEGIETRSQFEKLRQLECEGGQGYYFAEPMDLERLREFLFKQDIIELPDVHFAEIPTFQLVQ
jgi:diguanylate cyclase (GGDEF)-like protein/PAS domain S-box-containing protein